MPIPKDMIDKLTAENKRLRSELASLKQDIPSSKAKRGTADDVLLNKEKSSAILHALPIAAALASMNGNIEFINPKFVELFGYEIADIPTLQDWFRRAYPEPEYREFILSKWLPNVESAHLTGSEIKSMEVRVTCKDGSTKDVSIKGALMADGTLATFNDLSESKKTRKALLESEFRFKAVFKGARDGMLLVDGTTKKFYMANQAILNMMGYSEDEILQLHVADIHPRESLETVNDYLSRQLRGEMDIAPNLPVKRKDGEIFYADINAGPLMIDNRKYLVCIIRDISERKRYIEELLREKDFSNAALSSLPGVFYMFDQNGQFLRWNRNFEIVSGYSYEEMKRISPIDLFQGDDKILVQKRIQESFEKGVSDVEANFTTKNGDKIPYYFTGLMSHIGGKPCLVGMGIDISRQKQAEKMQALGQLAGGIAHDFNNQLAAILGFAEILTLKLNDEKLLYYAEMIARAATRSADLIRQLLAFAHKGKYQSELVDIHDIITEVSALLTRSIDKRITIKHFFSTDPSTTLGDANQIHNAFLNLAINARDAMPNGGELIFSTSHDYLNGTVDRDTPFDIEPGKYLKVSVSDTGKGMTEEVKQHIYEPFFTTKKVGEGTGMGLAAVYGTIKSHKGMINVSSKLGRGSTFHIYLPRVENKVEGEKPAGSVAKTMGSKATILIVDDEDLIRMLASDILNSVGYEVVLCGDGEEALAIYEKQWERISLIILDLMMPNMSGAQTFALLRKINPGAKILLLSGYSIDGQAQTLLNEGAMDFIQKPFAISQLTEKVAQSLAQSDS